MMVDDRKDMSCYGPSFMGTIFTYDSYLQGTCQVMSYTCDSLRDHANMRDLGGVRNARKRKLNMELRGKHWVHSSGTTLSEGFRDSSPNSLVQICPWKINISNILQTKTVLFGGWIFQNWLFMDLALTKSNSNSNQAIWIKKINSKMGGAKTSQLIR